MKVDWILLRLYQQTIAKLNHTLSLCAGPAASPMLPYSGQDLLAGHCIQRCVLDLLRAQHRRSPVTAPERLRLPEVAFQHEPCQRRQPNTMLALHLLRRVSLVIE